MKDKTGRGHKKKNQKEEIQYFHYVQVTLSNKLSQHISFQGIRVDRVKVYGHSMVVRLYTSPH